MKFKSLDGVGSGVINFVLLGIIAVAVSELLIVYTPLLLWAIVVNPIGTGILVKLVAGLPVPVNASEPESNKRKSPVPIPVG